MTLAKGKEREEPKQSRAEPRAESKAKPSQEKD